MVSVSLGGGNLSDGGPETEVWGGLSAETSRVVARGGQG